MKNVKSIKDINVEGKRVFVRVDFNVPVDKDGNISDDNRIVAALPTIEYLLENGAKVILASHFGRPKGKRMPEFSLKNVGIDLAKKLNQPILFMEDCIGKGTEEAINDMAESSVALLENLRFYNEEEANDSEFSQNLAKLADVYVNDAFGTAHRAHASTAGMVQFVNEKAVGFLVEKELSYLVTKIDTPERPFCVILGGAKVSDKIDVIEALIDKADKILIGGAMAYTFALANGKNVGKSLCEPDKIELAKRILEKAIAKNVPILLPIDTIATNEFDFNSRKLGELKTFDGNIDDDWEGVDIGPKTVKLYEENIKSSKTVLWNGPVGVFEIKESAEGSFAIAKAMAECQGTTIVGGGDCVKAVKQSGLSDKISFLSTGGGASLQLLEGKPLPGIEALKI